MHMPFTLGLFFCILLSLRTLATQTIQSDICVYGGTSGGIVAAVQAARMGKTAVLLEFGRHLGGMSSGGLGQTDIGNKGAIGGLSREFYRRIGKHYGQEEQWTFEPHVAEQIFYGFLNESRVPVYLQQRLMEVRKSGARLTELAMENGKVFRAKMFIDATYEGDLMAQAKVQYSVGREANSQYNESLNGIRAKTPFHQFLVPVDPYAIPGQPNSGLLPLIQAGDAGRPGQADQAVQAYNFRLVLTRNPANKQPITPPKNYDPAQFELLARYLEALVAAGKTPTLGQLMHIQMMPNGKTDINNNGGFSTDFIGANWAYPEADYPARAKIWQDHENYTRGFLHFLATNPRVPESLRAEMQSWGLTRDEFLDTGGWPHQLYIREARRMISDYVMTEHNCRGQTVAADSVGLAAYTMDSHNCRRIARNGRAENEGDVQVGGFPPYPISYRAIVPKPAQCENLLVPICLSASHIAYGSIRMEPVFMVLGQSAATAAALAIDANSTVQQINLHDLQSRLRADKQILDWKANPKVASGRATPKTLPGIVLDDSDGAKEGQWIQSTSVSWNVGTGYVHDANSDKGQSSIVFNPDIPETGRYEIVLLYTPNPNRATNVPVILSLSGDRITTKVNQQIINNNGFANLGTFNLQKGKSTSITISNADTDGFVVVDGLQLLRK